MYIDKQDAEILVIRLYFPLDTVHVSDYVSPSTGAPFISCTSYLVYAGTIVWLLCWYMPVYADTIRLAVVRL